jgi:phage shock protein A
MVEVGEQLDELYQAQLEFMAEVRRRLAGVGEVRERLAQEAARLGGEAEGVAAECDRMTAAGDARAARALLNRQRELLDRIEAANIELRTAQDFEAALTRDAGALQQTVNGLRTAKESAKAEIALARAERAEGRDSGA